MLLILFTCVNCCDCESNCSIFFQQMGGVLSREFHQLCLFLLSCHCIFKRIQNLKVTWMLCWVRNKNYSNCSLYCRFKCSILYCTCTVFYQGLPTTSEDLSVFVMFLIKACRQCRKTFRILFCCALRSADNVGRPFCLSLLLCVWLSHWSIYHGKEMTWWKLAGQGQGHE